MTLNPSIWYILHTHKNNNKSPAFKLISFGLWHTHVCSKSVVGMRGCIEFKTKFYMNTFFKRFSTLTRLDYSCHEFHLYNIYYIYSEHALILSILYKLIYLGKSHQFVFPPNK